LEKKQNDLGAVSATEGDAGPCSVPTDSASHDANDYDASLDVTIERDAVVIRIGVKTLAHACTYSDWANKWNDEEDDYIREFAIIDVRQFAKDIITEMLNEREDGSTPLSDFLDKVTEKAVNQGSLGLDVEEHQIKHGERSPLETW
jgi:hypothetical protein